MWAAVASVMENRHHMLRKIITAHFDELNADSLTLPDGSGRPLRLRLTRKEQISVRINDNPAN